MYSDRRGQYALLSAGSGFVLPERLRDVHYRLDILCTFHGCNQNALRRRNNDEPLDPNRRDRRPPIGPDKRVLCVDQSSSAFSPISVPVLRPQPP